MSHTEEHKAEASKKLSTIGRRYFELIEFDDEEEMIAEIRKHPFGLFLVEFTGFAISFIIGVLPIILLLNINSADLGVDVTDYRPLIVLAGMILALLGLGATFIAALIYKHNVIYVTSEKIAQVIYTSIFSRKISQLSIGDLQDVTVSQGGVFPRLFKYGTLVIETAGEQQNYTFTYVPDPYNTARQIVNAHENNLKAYGN